MAETHVLSALIAKRSELAGKIEFVQTELRQLIIDIDNLDATIRLFDPQIDLVAIKPKPLPARNTAFRGEVARIVLATLRKADGPLPLHEITMHVVVGRSLNPADKPLLRVLSKRVGACLRHYRGLGLVQSVDGPARAILWQAAKGTEKVLPKRLC
jgi:hypothetical protein